MENVSDFIQLADEAVADFREWRRFLELAIKSAQNGDPDSLSLHQEASRLHTKSDESREAVLAAAEGLPTILEAAGEDSSRGLLVFINLFRGREGLAELRTIESWEKLRPDLNRFAIRQGLPEGKAAIPAGWGVSLQIAANQIRPGEPDAQTELIKLWRNSKNPKLPRPIGKSPKHKQQNLYEPASIIAFLENIFGEPIAEEYGLRKAFSELSVKARSETD